MKDLEKDVKKETNLKEFEDWHEKRSKKIIPFIVTLLIILLIIAGYYTYFYIFNNTERFLDKINETANEYISETFKEIKEAQNQELINLDSQIKGNINLEVDKNTFELDFDYKNSPKKLLTSLDLIVNQDNNRLIGGNINFQDNKLYLKSDEVSKNLLELDLDGNLLETEESVDTSYMILTNMEDLEYFVSKMFEYHIKALKAGELSTKPNGFTEKQYIVKLNATEKIKANEKLEELVNKDSKLSSIIKRYNIENYNQLLTGELIVNVNVFNNEIKDFALSTNDFDLKGEYDGEKYILTDETSDYAYLWITDKKINMEVYENNTMTGSMSIVNSNDEVSFSLSSEGTLMTFTIKELDDKNGKMTLSLHSDDSNLDMNITANIVVENDKKYIVEGTGDITASGEKVNVSFKIEQLYDENLINRIDVTNSKNIEKLTEDEQLEVLTNIYTLFEKLGLYDEEMAS